MSCCTVQAQFFSHLSATPFLPSPPCRRDAGSHAATGRRRCICLHLVTTAPVATCWLSLKKGGRLLPSQHLNNGTCLRHRTCPCSGPEHPGGRRSGRQGLVLPRWSQWPHQGAGAAECEGLGGLGGEVGTPVGGCKATSGVEKEEPLPGSPNAGLAVFMHNPAGCSGVMNAVLMSSRVCLVPCPAAQRARGPAGPGKRPLVSAAWWHLGVKPAR